MDDLAMKKRVTQNSGFFKNPEFFSLISLKPHSSNTATQARAESTARQNMFPLR
jgi:hypothetical protein